MARAISITGARAVGLAGLGGRFRLFLHRPESPAALPHRRIGHPVGQRAELHFRQEGRSAHPGSGSFTAKSSIVKSTSGDIRLQQHQFLARARICSRISRSATRRRFGCFISSARVQQGLQIAIFIDQQAPLSSPRYPARRAHCPHCHRPSACTSTTRSGPTPNFSSHARPARCGLPFIGSSMSTPPPTSCIRSLSLLMMVTRPARVARLNGEGGDDIVGLVPLDFLAGDVESLGGAAGQRDLRAQILGHRLAVGLVLGEKLVSEGVAALVEDHRHMGRRIGSPVVLHHLEQHVAKARDRPIGNPSDLRLSGGSAWKARKMKADPSIRCR